MSEYSGLVTNIAAQTVEQSAMHDADKAVIAARLRGMQADLDSKNAEIAALREAVRVLANECDAWRTHTEENYYTNAMRACRKTDANPLAAAAVREAKEQA